MNILYLIGNGFDLAQDAKTRYKDFYKYYVDSEPVNDVEKQLIASIKDDIGTWSNMEEALGQFTKDVSDLDAFEEAYNSLSDKLRVYLQSEESKVSLTVNAVKYLSTVLSHFTEREQVLLAEAFNRIGGEVFISVISFNYTSLFEKAVANQKPSAQIDPPFMKRATFLTRKFKIHGSLDSTMLMGVDNPTQIANPEMAKDRNTCDFLVKPQANFVIGNLMDDNALELIGYTDVIVVFGMSIGITDKTWWQAIYDRLHQNTAVRLLLFYYTDDVDKRREYRSRRKKEEFKNRFFDVVGASPEDREAVANRIFVSLSKRFFSKDNE